MSSNGTASERGAGRGLARLESVPLLWRLFATTALLFTLATVVLIVSPARVSRDVVLAEVAIVVAGLGLTLLAQLVVLRRALAPLRALTTLMGAVDPLHPGRRLPQQPGRVAEVQALTRAFDGMLDRLEHERQDSARRALAAQEDERLRIARELHDQVGQTLTALTLQAEHARAQDPIDPAALDRVGQTALRALDDVRRIARELRPEALDDLGLGNALITLCRRMGESAPIPVVPHLTPGLPQLDGTAELVAYRVAQEAITNALRHARATRVDVTLREHDGGVELRVRDDGVGLPAAPPRDTVGLAGMRERALLAGAELTFATPAGGGTELRLRLPGTAVA